MSVTLLEPSAARDPRAKPEGSAAKPCSASRGPGVSRLVRLADENASAAKGETAFFSQVAAFKAITIFDALVNAASSRKNIVFARQSLLQLILALVEAGRKAVRNHLTEGVVDIVAIGSRIRADVAAAFAAINADWVSILGDADGLS